DPGAQHAFYASASRWGIDRYPVGSAYRGTQRAPGTRAFVGPHVARRIFFRLAIDLAPPSAAPCLHPAARWLERCSREHSAGILLRPTRSGGRLHASAPPGAYGGSHILVVAWQRSVRAFPLSGSPSFAERCQCLPPGSAFAPAFGGKDSRGLKIVYRLSLPWLSVCPRRPSNASPGPTAR